VDRRGHLYVGHRAPGGGTTEPNALDHCRDADANQARNRQTGGKRYGGQRRHPEEIKYSAPVPLDPPPEGRVSWRSRVLLSWTPVGELAEDEYYRLEFDRSPTTEGMEPYGDYVFVKDNQYLWEKAALAPFHPPEVQGDAMVYWWVRAVRKTGEDENGKPLGIDISPPSDKWVLILEPKPEGE